MADERYTMGEAARMLNVDAKTLRDWLAKMGMEPTPDKYDARRKWLTAEQLATLAAAHERTPRPPATLADALARLDELEARIVALEDAQQRHNAPVTRYDGRETAWGGRDDESTSPRSQRRYSGTYSGAVLPDGLTKWNDFLHGVPERTIQGAIKRGDVPTAAGGPWRVGRVDVKYAFDATGRRRLWELYHTHPRWQPCDACPHALEAANQGQ